MGKIVVSPGAVKANKEKIEKIHKDLAYTAVKSGNSWMLPSGQNASVGEYVILNGELGKITGSNAITGGSTAIVSGTNWTKLDNAGAMGVVKSLSDQIATLVPKANITYVQATLPSTAGNVNVELPTGYDFNHTFVLATQIFYTTTDYYFNDSRVITLLISDSGVGKVRFYQDDTTFAGKIIRAYLMKIN